MNKNTKLKTFHIHLCPTYRENTTFRGLKALNYSHLFRA